MLYVSRMLSKGKVCVTDTDDGVEEVLVGEDIVRCVRDLGIDIKGITLVERGGRIHVYADVYQPSSTVSTLQTKSKMLRGVDIKVSGDKITSVRWDKLMPSTPVTIRLSEFGTSCADYLFWWEGLCSVGNLTLVFDDKISITSKSLKYISVLGLRVDLNEVTNEKLARLVYRSYAESYRGRYLHASKYPSLISDNPVRLQFWQALYYLNHGVSTLSSQSSVFYDEAVVNLLFKELGSEFKAIVKAQFVLIESWDCYRKCRSYAQHIDSQYMIGETNYHELVECCTPEIFDILGRYTTLSKGVVTRFRNFIQYVSDVPEEVQSAFVSLCTRFNNYIWEEYESGRFG